MNFRTQSEEIKRQVGYMTQRFSFWEDLSIRENLDFVAQVYGLRGRHARVDETLERLGLTHRQHQLAGELSGGWKQRMALAACMLHDPKLLLLDEPTAGVDPKARRDFWDEIHALSAKGLTVLVSTHYMDEAERCDRIVYILNGKLVARGTVAEVIAQSGLVTFVVRAKARASWRRNSRASPAWNMSPSSAPPCMSAAMTARRWNARLRPTATIPTSTYAKSRRAGRRVHPASGAGPMIPQMIAMIRHFSGHRTAAILVKEFIQMRRDPLTLAMIIGIPIMQLFLFGFAINLNPKNLPTAISIDDPGVFARSIVAALHNSNYFDIVEETNSPAEARRLLNEGKVAFVVEIPVNFTRDVVRGAQSAIAGGGRCDRSFRQFLRAGRHQRSLPQARCTTISTARSPRARRRRQASKS